MYTLNECIGGNTLQTRQSPETIGQLPCYIAGIIGQPAPSLSCRCVCQLKMICSAGAAVPRQQRQTADATTARRPHYDRRVEQATRATSLSLYYGRPTTRILFGQMMQSRARMVLASLTTARGTDIRIYICVNKICCIYIFGINQTKYSTVEPQFNLKLLSNKFQVLGNQDILKATLFRNIGNFHDDIFLVSS